VTCEVVAEDLQRFVVGAWLLLGDVARAGVDGELVHSVGVQMQYTGATGRIGNSRSRSTFYRDSFYRYSWTEDPSGAPRQASPRTMQHVSVFAFRLNIEFVLLSDSIHPVVLRVHAASRASGRPVGLANVCTAVVFRSLSR
jgi:hypothetical protein